MEIIPLLPEDTAGEEPVRHLYRQFLDSWNRRDGAALAACFSEKGHMVGFDGSSINGRAEIENHISRIFRDHLTPAYISIVREVRFLTPEVTILRAVTGLIPSGQTDINPDLNSVQSVIARYQDDAWMIELFQNTPAAFHGQPELSQQLSAELRRLITP